METRSGKDAGIASLPDPCRPPIESYQVQWPFLNAWSFSASASTKVGTVALTRA
jgi:hypothetical protein